MIYPSKYEDLSKSILILGAEVIKLLNKRHSLNIDYVYEKINSFAGDKISIDKYYDLLTFLWLTNIIDVSEYNISLKNNKGF